MKALPDSGSDGDIGSRSVSFLPPCLWRLSLKSDPAQDADNCLSS